MLGQTGGEFQRTADEIPVKQIAQDICGRWLALCRYAGLAGQLSVCRIIDGTEPKERPGRD